MIKQLLDPNAVIRSISLALEQNFDCEDAIKRTLGYLANLPNQKIYVRKNRSNYVFYQSVDNNKQYLPKSSPLLYKLCRRQYLEYVLQALDYKSELRYSTRKKDVVHQDFTKTVDRIKAFLKKCSEGNLDIARIVLSQKQYRWLSGKYIRKNIEIKNVFITKRGTVVRSKSERDIGNIYESLAIPYHYEEQASVFVHPLVLKLEETLREKNQLSGYLYYRKGNRCFWKVPPELEWMNAPGSVWKTYQPNNGKITMFNDFRIMLADSNFLIHEHEGMAENFMYRRNASERIFILKMSKEFNKENIIDTFENEISNAEIFTDYIVKKILPQIWF